MTVAAGSKEDIMSPKQIVIVAVGVAVLIAGITYVVISIGTAGAEPPKPTDEAVSKLPSPLEMMKAVEPRFEEAYTAGHHPFRFRSLVDKPTKVGVNWKNCKCASVEICVAPDEWKALSEAEFAKKADDPSLQWTPLERDGQGFDIPGRSTGWVRVGWKADKNGDERFKADLWIYEFDSGIGFPLEVAVSFVEAVRVRWLDDPDKIDPYVGRIGPGEQKDAQLVVWSSTRESFTLESDPPRSDPNFSYGEPPRKLKAEELDNLSQRFHRKALSGYQVTVTVREKVGEQQLDIGPFRREVRWKSDAVKDPIRAHVQGIVLGEVRTYVEGNPGEPRLEMGVIDPNRPRVHKLQLETDNPNVELAHDDSSCDFLKVDVLDKAGKVENLDDGSVRKTWNVNVSLRPGAGFRGPFPDKEKPGYELTAVVFRITHAGVANERPRYVKVLARGQVKN